MLPSPNVSFYYGNVNLFTKISLYILEDMIIQRIRVKVKIYSIILNNNKAYNNKKTERLNNKDFPIIIFCAI